MAVFNRVQANFKPTSTPVVIPNDPVARLMYYLNSMCSVLKIDDDEDINRLRRYNNYHSLTHADRNVLVSLCMLLKPNVLLNKCIFQNDAMCGDRDNKFYDLETVNNSFFVAGSIAIGGQQRRVNKIMTFKMNWLRNNWSTPMQLVVARQERERREILARRPTAMVCAIQ